MLICSGRGVNNPVREPLFGKPFGQNSKKLIRLSEGLCLLIKAYKALIRHKTLVVAYTLPSLARGVYADRLTCPPERAFERSKGLGQRVILILSESIQKDSALTERAWDSSNPLVEIMASWNAAFMERCLRDVEFQDSKASINSTVSRSKMGTGEVLPGHRCRTPLITQP